MTTDNAPTLAHLEEVARLARELTLHGVNAALKPRERQVVLGLQSAVRQLREAVTGRPLPTRASHSISQVAQFAHGVSRRYDGSYELGMVIGTAINGVGVYDIDADVYAGIVARLKAEQRALGAVIHAIEGHALMLAERDGIPFTPDAPGTAESPISGLERLLDGARAKGHAGLRLMVTTHLGSDDHLVAAYVLDASGTVGSPFLLPREQEVWLHDTLTEGFAADFTYHPSNGGGGLWLVTTVGKAYDDGGEIALDDEGHEAEVFTLAEIFDPSPEDVEELFDKSDFTEDGEEAPATTPTTDEKKVVITWRPGDLRTFRPTWSEEQCEAALDAIGRRLRDRSVEEGHAILAALLSEYEADMETDGEDGIEL